MKRPLLALVLTAGAAAAAALELRATTEEPRAFGHRVGDVVTRVIHVDVPAGLSLDAEALPVPGRIGPALDLRSIERSERRIDGGMQLRLELRFQVFAAPVAARVYDLPVLKLRFEGGGRSQELRVDPWPLAVAPLGPEEPSPRHGLGELRPDAPPPPADTTVLRAVVAASLAVSALIGGWLWIVYRGLPWWSRRHRPFAAAWRDLQAARRRGSLGQGAAACLDVTQRLHAALNATAGRVLFAEGLDAFVAAAPRYAPLRGELGRFFDRSRAGFFAAAPDADLDWLLGIARALRDAERGTG